MENDEIKYEDMLCFRCPYKQCFMNGNIERKLECTYEKELREKDENDIDRAEMSYNSLLSLQNISNYIENREYNYLNGDVIKLAEDIQAQIKKEMSSLKEKGKTLQSTQYFNT
jgi:hypothetical protein